MSILPVYLVILLIICGVDANLFPQGYQWKYSYHAFIRAGTLLPTDAYSQWDLRALLTITAVNNQVIAQLSNYNSSIYNGLRENAPQDLHPSPIPEDAQALGTKFLLHYNDMNVEAISTDTSDPLWAVNIKRSIASTLQLNLNNLGSPASFVSEINIYGDCQGIEYSVVNNTEYIYVRKVIDHKNCIGFPVRDWSSTVPFLCPGVADEPFSASTTREYTLAHRNQNFHLEHILSNRRVYVQPFQALSDAQQIYQYQVYQLLSSPEAVTEIKLEENFERKSLVYEHNFNDFTHGRFKHVNQKIILEQIRNSLEKFITKLENQKLEKDPTKHENEMLELLYYTYLLDTESLKTLYSDIRIGTSYRQETRRNIFLELLPQIGTTDSVNLMKELIIKRELKDLASIKMLSVYPFYVRQPSTKLLSDMEVLLNVGDNYDPAVRHTAILSFATLVYQTISAGQCTLETLEHYSLKYFNLFSESTNYEQRMVYLQGLDNLQLGSISNYLKSVIQNNEQSRHIRFLAIWASMATAPFRPAQIYELYWPILTDRRQHLEMRVAAFTMLFIAQPTRSRLLTLFWYMQAETDPHLYNFFYTTIISIQKSTYPCYANLGKLASHIQRFLQSPNSRQHWITGNYILDYMNTDRTFGAMMHLFLIGNPVTDTPNVVYLTINNYATQKNLNQVAIYLKLQGIAEHVKDIFNVTDKLTFDKLIKILEKSNIKFLPMEEIHMEIIIKVQGKNVFCRYIDNNKFDLAIKILKHIELLLQYHLNYQSIVLPFLSEHLEPSDIGTLLVRGVILTSVASMRGNITSLTEEQTNSNNLDLDFRYYTYTTNFIQMYNPLSNMWHGTFKSRNIQGQFLFNGTLYVDKSNSLIKLSEERNGGEYVNVISHSKIVTFIYGNGTKNVLQHHCPKCVDNFVVGGKEPKKNQELINTSFKSLGTQFEMAVFDCDSYNDIKNVFSDVYLSHHSNSEIMPTMEPILYILHTLDFFTFISPHGGCGISMNLKPFYKEPTELALTVKITNITEGTHTEYINTFSLAHTKLPNRSKLQFWNVTNVWYSDPRKRINNITTTVDYSNVMGKKQKLCLNMKFVLPEQEVDIFSIKPVKDAVLGVDVMWDSNLENFDSCPSNGASVQSEIIASVSDEQKKQILSSEKWPYKECRDSSVDQKFTPISVACYLTSKEASTYRKYSASTKFSNVPEWFVHALQRVQSFIGLLESQSSPNVLIEKSTDVNHITTSIEFSATDPKIFLKMNNKSASLKYSNVKFIDHFLMNTKIFNIQDWNIYLGLSKVCLVTPKFIVTTDNRTIPNDEIKLRKKDILLTADCSQYPKYGIFLHGPVESNYLSFTMYAGTDSFSITSHNENLILTLNGQVINGDKNSEYIDIWYLQNDVVLIKNKHGRGVDIHYTKDYMVIIVPGLHSEKVCGVCSSLKKHVS